VNQNETDLIAGIIATAILRSVTPTLQKARAVSPVHDPDPVSPAGAVSRTSQKDADGFAVGFLGSPGATPEKGHWVTMRGHAVYIDDDGNFRFHGKNGPATHFKAPGFHNAARSSAHHYRERRHGGEEPNHARMRRMTRAQHGVEDKEDHLRARDLAQYAAHHVATIAGRTADRRSTKRWQEEYALANPVMGVLDPARPSSQPPVQVALPEQQIPAEALANADRIHKAVLASSEVWTQQEQVLDQANREAQRAVAAYERQQRAHDRDPSQPAPDPRAVRDALANENRVANEYAHEREVHRVALHALFLEPAHGKGMTVRGTPPPTVQGAVDRGLAFINRLVGPNASWQTQDATAPQVTVNAIAQGKRAHYSGMGVMSIAKGDRAGTVVHELGHYLEDSLAGVEAQRATWFAKRVEGQAPTRILDASGHALRRIRGHAEWGYVDSFRSHYVGKVYPTDPLTQRSSSEVISMGCEYLHDDPVAFAKGDPDHFRFTIAALKGTP